MIYFIYLACSFLMNFDNQLVCHHIENPIKIDGELNEKEWSFADSIILNDSKKRSVVQATVRVLWSEDNLYISFLVHDQDIRANQTVLDHPKLFLDDMVEFLIDTENDKNSCWGMDDFIYHINVLGQKKDDRGTDSCLSDSKWNGVAKYAVKVIGTINEPLDIDTGYIVEVGIPWKELKINAFPKILVSVNFAIGDNGNLFDWVNAKPFRNQQSFGDLLLVQ